MKKLLVILMAFVLLCTSLIGCNSGEDDPTQTLDPNHTSVAVLTEKDFILNGSTDYKVVLPEDNTEYENVAAGELINFMYEATGVKLSLINENASIIATDSSKYVFIGQTQANKELNQDFSDTALTQDGFKIITKNNNYHLLGGTRFGNVYACYELMYHLIGWEIYAENEIVYNQGSTVKFKEITANEIPDFEYRISGNVGTYNDDSVAMRFRYMRAHSYGFAYVTNNRYSNIADYAEKTMVAKPKTAQEKAEQILDKKIEALTDAEMNAIILEVFPDKDLSEELLENEQVIVRVYIGEKFKAEINQELYLELKNWANEKFADDEDGLKEFIKVVLPTIEDAKLNALIRDNDKSVLEQTEIETLVNYLYDELYKDEQAEIDERLTDFTRTWLTEKERKTVINSVMNLSDADYAKFIKGEGQEDLTESQKDALRDALWVKIRQACVSAVKAGVSTRLYHNGFAYLPPVIFNNPAFKSNDPELNLYHPDWFSTSQITGGSGGHYDKCQICYNAKGNKVERDAMIKEAVEVLLDTVKLNPTIDNIQFSMEDNTTWCSCVACQKDMEVYGAASASVVRFCNDLHDLLEIRLEEEGIDRDINIVFFSYLAISDAPVKRTDDGQVELVKSEEFPSGISCKDGVYAFYCPVYMNYYETIEAEKNRAWLEYLEEWSLICSDLYCWYYGTNFQNYLIPYNNFSSLQENYQIAKEWGVNYLFDEGQHYASTPKPSGFTYLKDYLGAKLMWNVNADVNELTNNFFKHYFKDAAPAMRKYYDSLRVNFEYIYNVKGIGGGIFEDVLSADLWKEGVIRQWLGFIEEAYQAIEPLKQTDKATYDKLVERIKIESISPRYLYLALYLDTDTSESTMQMKREFKQDLLYWNWGEQGQGLSIDSLWTRWGV